MTGDGDRLDGIVELLAASDFDRIGHIDNDDVRWLCRGLRDARAEIERLRARSDAAERMCAYQLPMVEAELAAERAKVQRVEALCDEYRANCSPDSKQAQVAEIFRAALAEGEDR